MHRSPWLDQSRSGSTSDVSSRWRWIESLPKSTVRVTEGMHRFYSPNDDTNKAAAVAYIRVDLVTYGNLDHDGMEEAAVQLTYHTSGTQAWNYLYIFKMSKGGPVPMAVLRAGERAYGGLLNSQMQNGQLVLDFADQDRRVGDCCSEGFIRVYYRWKDGHFVETGSRERGDVHVEEH